MTEQRAGFLLYSVDTATEKTKLKPHLPVGPVSNELYRFCRYVQWIIHETFRFLKMKTPCCAEISGTQHPVMGRYMPEERRYDERS